MKYNSRINNFDFMRLFLSITIFLGHYAILSQHPDLNLILKYFDPELIVDAFFVISGFLIFLSYDNKPINKIYFKKRIKRILPIYLISIIFFSFILLFFSTKSVEDYFDIQWFTYLYFNSIFLNFIQPNIDGVFQNNPLQAVNGALWTLKLELMFYFLVPIIFYIISKTNRLIVLITLYLLSIAYVLSIKYLYAQNPNPIYLTLLHQLPGKFSFFMMGAILYFYHGYFKKNAIIYFIIAIIIFYLNHQIDLYFLYPIALSILVIYIATIMINLGNWGKYGDFSYTIYVIHFPIIQIFISKGYIDQHPYLMLIIILSLILTISFFAWRYIEKPLMRGNWREMISNSFR